MQQLGRETRRGDAELRQTKSRSSLRTQGPITTDLRCCEKAGGQHLPNNRRSVWVPAFAGTTVKIASWLFDI
jgi:hypothetical protein